MATAFLLLALFGSTAVLTSATTQQRRSHVTSARAEPKGREQGLEEVRRRWEAEFSRGGYVLPALSAVESKGMSTATKVVGNRNRRLPLGFGFWSVRGSKFVDQLGRQVRFSGVTWTGFETPEALVSGLDRRSIESYLDQMKKLGFNLIRLPFAGDTLKKSTYPSGYIHDSNVNLRGRTSLECMDRLIQEARKRGIKVILCYHRLHLTVSNEWGVWWDDSAPEEVWVMNWVMLARRYINYNNVIGADLYNEVHPNDEYDSFPGAFPKGAPYWVYHAGPNEKYNFRRATLRVITHVRRVHPHWIFFLEGMHNDYWWGGNCAELLKAPITRPANKIAFTAHEYGPYVYDGMKHFQDPSFPKNLWATFRKYWGFIQEKGIKPVWVGEFGSFYPEKDNRKNWMESTTFESLVSYIGRLRASWTVFQWNPNSKDTGGVLRDDWNTPDEKKMKLLRKIMHYGFRP